MRTNLDKMAGVLSHTLQVVSYREANISGHDYEYICEAVDPNAKLNDKAWRIKRIKTEYEEDNPFNGPLVNVCFAKLGGHGTSQFVFKATDLTYCKNLEYNLN